MARGFICAMQWSDDPSVRPSKGESEQDIPKSFSERGATHTRWSGGVHAALQVPAQRRGCVNLPPGRIAPLSSSFRREKKDERDSGGISLSLSLLSLSASAPKGGRGHSKLKRGGMGAPLPDPGLFFFERLDIFRLFVYFVLCSAFETYLYLKSSFSF